MKYLLLLFLLSGCTDAGWDAAVGKLGVAASVKCYSGTRLIYDGKSTGAIKSPTNSDGYQFRQQNDGKFKEVSGNCDITYDD